MSKEIYDNQRKTGMEIYTRWKESHKTILLVAQCQSGKTGAQLSLCDEVILRGAKPNWKETEIYLLGPSDSNLEKQTLKQFRGHDTYVAALNDTAPYLIRCLSKESCPEYLHWGKNKEDAHNFFRDLKHKRDKGKFVVTILDESHLGQGEESQYDELFERYKIPLGKTATCKDNEIYVACSATPSPRITGKSLEEIRQNYSVCYMRPGESYYGISEFLRDGRIKQTFDPVLNFGSFMDEVVSPFLSGEAGSLIVRITRETKIKQFEELIKEHNINLKVYDSSRGTIKDLDNDILEDKDKHYVRIVKQSYKQGMVLANKHLIRGWFDTSSDGKNSASDLQSIGRNFGYDDKLGRYSIAKLKYNIWCNVEDAERASIYYKQMELLSDGKFDSVDLEQLQMSSTHANASIKTLKNRAIFYEAFDTIEKAEEYLKKREILKTKYVVTKLYEHREGIPVDYAWNYINSGYLQMAIKAKDVTHAIVDCRKPQPGYEDSWNMLVKTGDFIRKPCKGKVAVAFLKKDVKQILVTNNSMHG